MKMEQRVSAEVARLHRFFDAWYDGQDGLSISEFADAMDQGFVIVSPDGNALSRETIVSGVESDFGKGGLSITVGNFDVMERNGYVVCRYDEIHTSADDTATRISTAVMEIDDATPGGFRWVTVHETWAKR